MKALLKGCEKSEKQEVFPTMNSSPLKMKYPELSMADMKKDMIYVLVV
ncbi:hypothetical protein AQPE_2011 [Aquipluma nitroreducens]|uniref:Uncharacterized protein n=1 Tax=Aquipluma nitroreducens TaxID=2010828 RepID=A0A5K7S8H1_9BACT|nr:hypothetical protein AQPE_2011 [Aquipluma nitroreducens]